MKRIGCTALFFILLLSLFGCVVYSQVKSAKCNMTPQATVAVE